MWLWIVLADIVSAHKLNHTNTFISVKVEHILCPQGFLIIIDIGVMRSPYQSMKSFKRQIEHTKFVAKKSKRCCYSDFGTIDFRGSLHTTQLKPGVPLEDSLKLNGRLFTFRCPRILDCTCPWCIMGIRHVQTESMDTIQTCPNIICLM